MSEGRTDIGFENPFISELNFKINKDFIGDFDGDVNVELSLETKKEGKIDEETSVYLSKLNLIVGEITDYFPFYCEIEMSGRFFRKEYSDIKEEDFAKRNAAAILYSYARPIVSDIVSKSGFPPYNIPFMNFSDLDVDEDHD